jgi:ADP-ribosylglycohydrolase
MAKNPRETLLFDRILGALRGGAVGDALGAPAEDLDRQEIEATYGRIRGFVPPRSGPEHLGKGGGRFTDDTLLTLALCHVYSERRDHLDAFDFATLLVPELADRIWWVPERGREQTLAERLFWSEKHIIHRLRYANDDPRLGGVGNAVNSGAAMFAAPVGLANAGDPTGAYEEAIRAFSAHQLSFGLEAAGGMACATAAALMPDATVESVVEAVMDHVKEGTRRATEATLKEAARQSNWEAAIPTLRSVIRRFDGSINPSGGKDHGKRSHEGDRNHPSRTLSVEEFPIALALLYVTGGDPRQALLAGANYGRDSDTIAGMAGTLAGAMNGAAALPQDWVDRMEEANRTSFVPVAEEMTAVAQEMAARDQSRWRTRIQAMDHLTA